MLRVCGLQQRRAGRDSHDATKTEALVQRMAGGGILTGCECARRRMQYTACAGAGWRLASNGRAPTAHPQEAAGPRRVERGRRGCRRGSRSRSVLDDAAYLSGLGDASLDTLLLLDGDRKIIWGNQAAWVMFGPAENAVGQTFIGLVHDYELNQAVLDATSRPIDRAADGCSMAERDASAWCPV